MLKELEYFAQWESERGWRFYTWMSLCGWRMARKMAKMVGSASSAAPGPQAATGRLPLEVVLRAGAASCA